MDRSDLIRILENCRVTTIGLCRAFIRPSGDRKCGTRPVRGNSPFVPFELQLATFREVKRAIKAIADPASHSNEHDRPPAPFRSFTKVEGGNFCSNPSSSPPPPITKLTLRNFGNKCERIAATRRALKR